MKTEALLKAPVFQLNLLVWMSREQPSVGYRVRPLFYKNDFGLVYIENPFVFPEETAKAIVDSGLNIGPAPNPDLILGRERDGKALYVEAKAGSFGPTSSDSRQARAHLLACGPAFGEVLAPLTSCLLCYVVPAEDCAGMRGCLDTLSKELRTGRFLPGPYSSLGLSIQEGQVVFSWDPAFKSHVGLPGDSATVLDGVSDDTDPSPLILVFSDEDCPNTENRDFYRRVVLEKIRACLLCDLHAHPVGPGYEATPDILLDKTMGGVFQYLGRERQKGLRRLIRENVFKRIRDYWRTKLPGVSLLDDGLRISWNVIGEKEDFLDWLEDRRTQFVPDRPPEYVQERMF
jgi:hypothetical protein